MKPAWVVQALTRNEVFSDRLCDPACRNYDLIIPLRQEGVSVYGSDIRTEGKGTLKIDFIKSKHYDTGMHHCICEPPDKLVAAFLKRALAVTSDSVCFLLDKEHLKTLKPTPTRVWFFHDQASMAWFVWDIKHPTATPRLEMAFKPEPPTKTLFRFSEAFYRR